MNGLRRTPRGLRKDSAKTLQDVNAKCTVGSILFVQSFGYRGGTLHCCNFCIIWIQDKLNHRQSAAKNFRNTEEHLSATWKHACIAAVVYMSDSRQLETSPTCRKKLSEHRRTLVCNMEATHGAQPIAAGFTFGGASHGAQPIAAGFTSALLCSRGDSPFLHHLVIVVYRNDAHLRAKRSLAL